MASKLFTYFGNKEHVAKRIWELFGQTDSFVEAFCGCASVLLACPSDIKHRWECLNDFDCHIANVFRSVKYHPEAVVEAAYGPRTEVDLHTRHDWLITHAEALRQHILSDPKACDPELAGWWIWGINLWIGGGWCSEAALKWKQKPGHRNQGLLTARKKPELGSNGTRGIFHGRGDRRAIIEAMVQAVSDRLIDVTICYGDFERVLTPSYTTQFGTCAVLLDPPYKGDKTYAQDVKGTWARAQDWFLAHYQDPQFRIILCGNSHDWPDPPDDVRVYKYNRTMAGMDHSNAEEALWISKHCVDESRLDWAL
jgi:DNA adenine methylase